jgi:hypothetical protein
VVPLFADGAQGAGTSIARGRLIARRPDDGPCNGDRVRLSYRDGSTAEGLWQDGTILRGDGIVHSHTSGQVRLGVVDQAEEWRPDAAVVGWVAGCTCGWRGTCWTRASLELADPAARRFAVTGPWADLEAADENRVMTEWRRHIAGWQALEDVKQAAAARALDEAVRADPDSRLWWSLFCLRCRCARASGPWVHGRSGRWPKVSVERLIHQRWRWV